MKNITIDTNVLIRFLIADIPSQYEIASKIFTDVENQKLKAWVSILVLNETVWILEHFYNIQRKQYVPQLLTLLALKNIRIIEIHKQTLTFILKCFESSTYDFTDLYLVYAINGKEILSFDKDIKKILENDK